MVRPASPTQPRLRGIGGRWIFVVAVVLTVAGMIAFTRFSRSNSLYFSDPLTGPASPGLAIPAGKYGYTPEGLRRMQSDDRNDRPIVRTVSGAYLNTTHFTAEVSVNVAAGDMAFFGLGQATSDPADHNEPSNCFLLRISNLADGRVHVVVKHGGAGTRLLDIRMIGTYFAGTTKKFRITRDGDYVTLAIPSENQGWTYSISQFNAQLGLTAGNTHLFFSNTDAGTVFSNFRIMRDPPAVENNPADPRKDRAVGRVTAADKNPPLPAAALEL